MFKIGEKIICVDSGSMSVEKKWNIKNGNIYTVKKYFRKNQSTFVTIDGELSEEEFFAWRFESIKEQRKLKLKKLKQNENW